MSKNKPSERKSQSQSESESEEKNSKLHLEDRKKLLEIERWKRDEKEREKVEAKCPEISIWRNKAFLVDGIIRIRDSNSDFGEVGRMVSEVSV